LKNISFYDEDYAGEKPETPAASDDHNGRALSRPEMSGSRKGLFLRIRNHCDGDVSPFYAPDRNAALALALAAAGDKSSLYLCSKTSYAANGGHAAINGIAGMKPLRVPSEFGKLHPETISEFPGALPEHDSARCKIVVLPQPTEYGLVYTPEEIEEICRCAHENDMLVLMDGSRLFFAAANLLRAFREQTLYAGVDVATFGAAKNGACGGEAVLVFRPEIAEKFRELQKGMRIDLSRADSFSAGFDRLLTHRLWRIRALHANEMAAILGSELSGIPGIRPVCNVETNKVIAEVTPAILRRLKQEYSLRTFGCPVDTVRFVTNYTTSREDVDRLMDVLR
jgi:threonine aldolase